MFRSLHTLCSSSDRPEHASITCSCYRKNIKGTFALQSYHAFLFRTTQASRWFEVLYGELSTDLSSLFFLVSLQGSSNASLWMRNIQLGSFSIFLGILAVILKDGAQVAQRGFYVGYTPMVWFCICLHSLGGIAVAMVVKYADNVVRHVFFASRSTKLYIEECHRYKKTYFL